MARGYRALWIWVVIEDAVVRKKPEQQVLHSAYPTDDTSSMGAPSRSVQDGTSEKLIRLIITCLAGGGCGDSLQGGGIY